MTELGPYMLIYKECFSITFICMSRGHGLKVLASNMPSAFRCPSLLSQLSTAKMWWLKTTVIITHSFCGSGSEEQLGSVSCDSGSLVKLSSDRAWS